MGLLYTFIIIFSRDPFFVRALSLRSYNPYTACGLAEQVDRSALQKLIILFIHTPCVIEGGELRRGTDDRRSAGRERRHGATPECGVADEVRVLYRDPIHAPAVHGAARAVVGLVLVKQRLVLEEHRGVRQVERTLCEKKAGGKDSANEEGRVRDARSGRGAPSVFLRFLT